MPEYNPQLIDEKVTLYLPLVRQGKTEVAIEEELKAEGIEPHNISYILRDLRKQHDAGLIGHTKTETGQNALLIGILLAVGGATLLVWAIMNHSFGKFVGGGMLAQGVVMIYKYVKAKEEIAKGRAMDK